MFGKLRWIGKGEQTSFVKKTDGIYRLFIYLYMYILDSKPDTRPRLTE